MVKEKYGKFDSLKRTSLSYLIDKLSLISAIEYSSRDHKAMVIDAQKIEHGIKDLGDLNKYYTFLKEEIDEREKKYFEGTKLTKETAYFSVQRMS